MLKIVNVHLYWIGHDIIVLGLFHKISFKLKSKDEHL